ncbi:L-threonine 3-dehydrogenase [Brevibacillus sp. SYP-B805]|uniref:L-threonine 3-dehydrogenase n=1 Tax=Brevibacillus sp. SYP-B805 TaxID=1578199 RepID=UPI0013EBB8AF|nr:L-threonine 3-dehydrogenase [Brevibacillus sp. SYP-B805]NGQ96383.1 L-threonine 3-dehydrogenase [Brevibacillus sp. SYP-B805]
MGTTMKAIMKHHAGPGAELREVPIPRIEPHEVLIQVKATSICGTDVHIYTWDAWAESRIKAPMVFGHEFSGVVVEVGSQVTGVKVGDHVSAETHVVCHQCLQCKTGQYHICQHTKILGVDFQGCFAEYVKMPAENIWKNPTDMPFEKASIQEPMGNAVHTVLAGPVAGKTVAVVGCGPIGIMAVAVAKASGATEVIALDVNEYRLDLARKVGATVTINSMNEDPVKRVMQVTEGTGVEVVCEMSGHPVAIRQAFEMLTNGGRMSILSLPTKPVELDITNQIVFKGVTVQGITGRKMYETWRQTSGLLHSGQVDVTPIITHTLPLENFREGFELMVSGKCGKVVLLP